MEDSGIYECSVKYVWLKFEIFDVLKIQMIWDNQMNLLKIIMFEKVEKVLEQTS